MSENSEDYGWFIRLATNPMSIRTLDNVKLVINFSDVVFHKIKYLGQMPGFQHLPNFNPERSENQKFIKVPPPQEYQFLSIKPHQVNDDEIEYEEVEDEEVEDEVEETEISPVIEDVNEQEDEEPSLETEETHDVDIKELESIRKEFEDFDNKKWVILKKDAIQDYLNRLGVSIPSENKWDMLKLLKSIIQG